ncbi:MAG: tetratricopeptide repeat protein [Candidatus Thorarchaeota archaeon]
MSVGYEDYTAFDWFAEAKSFEKSQEYDKALMAYDEALKLNPEMAKGWFYKAAMHYKLGQKDKAAECAKKAVELKPSWEKHVKRDMPDLQI